MGILETSDKKAVVASPATRRKSGLDFGSLKPLDAGKGTKNFGGYRDMQSPQAKQKSEDAMDSDADDEDDAGDEVEDEKDVVLDKGMLSPEDAAKQGELAEGVRKIKVGHVHIATVLRLTAAAQATALGRAAGPRCTGWRVVVRVSCIWHTGARELSRRGGVFSACSRLDRRRQQQRSVAVQEAPGVAAGVRRQRAAQPGPGAGGGAQGAGAL